MLEFLDRYPGAFHLWVLVVFVAATHGDWRATAPAPAVWTGGPPPGSVSLAERRARRTEGCQDCHTTEACFSCDTDPPVWELR